MLITNLKYTDILVDLTAITIQAHCLGAIMPQPSTRCHDVNGLCVAPSSVHILVSCMFDPTGYLKTNLTVRVQVWTMSSNKKQFERCCCLVKSKTPFAANRRMGERVPKPPGSSLKAVRMSSSDRLHSASSLP